VVNGFVSIRAGAFLTAHPDVNGITFTGETKTGTAIMKAGADGHPPGIARTRWQECAVVFADCDFENAVNTVTRRPLRMPARSASHRACLRGTPDL